VKWLLYTGHYILHYQTHSITAKFSKICLDRVGSIQNTGGSLRSIIILCTLRILHSELWLEEILGKLQATATHIVPTPLLLQVTSVAVHACNSIICCVGHLEQFVGVDVAIVNLIGHVRQLLPIITSIISSVGNFEKLPCFLN